MLIETILAAFEMEEILYELREHSAGLNAGRWDYMFSVIKKFRDRPEFVLPDRPLVTMTVPFMRAYTELLVKTCHRREAHAIGGMAAFIPSRRDPEVNAVALEKVRRGQAAGGDRRLRRHVGRASGSRPDRAGGVRRRARDATEPGRPQARGGRRDAAELLDVAATPGDVTEDGVRLNVSVGIQYIAAWLAGSGAAAINNLMEDAATAEISRSQVWQWVRHGRMTRERVVEIEADEMARLGPVTRPRARCSTRSRSRTSSSSSSRSARTHACPSRAAKRYGAGLRTPLLSTNTLTAVFLIVLSHFATIV